MNCETGFWHSFGLRWVPVSMRIRGELAIGAHFRATDSHEGGTVKAHRYRCSAAIWTGSRIASSANVPETSSVVSAIGLPCLTGRLAKPQLPFCFVNQSLLMLALWGCGRRLSVVQA
jgi:hypothetical protein